MSLPIELYGEIFTYLDFLTALRFRSVCKAFGKFHTAATREHSEVRSITEAIDLKKNRSN